jgi:hypothetical protein
MEQGKYVVITTKNIFLKLRSENAKTTNTDFYGNNGRRMG